MQGVKLYCDDVLFAFHVEKDLLNLQRDLEILGLGLHYYDLSLLKLVKNQVIRSLKEGVTNIALKHAHLDFDRSPSLNLFDVSSYNALHKVVSEAVTLEWPIPLDHILILNVK